MSRCRLALPRRSGPQCPTIGRHFSRTYNPVQAVLEDVVTVPDERVSNNVGNYSSNSAQAPGLADRDRFRLHWSVDMWRDFNSRNYFSLLDQESGPLGDRFTQFMDSFSSAIATSGILSSSQAVQYWAYHIARSGFFAAQAIIGLAAARGAIGRGSTSSPLTRFEEIARSGWRGPLAEAMLSYYQDFENIKEGRYVMPWDAALTHRQLNPLFVAGRSIRFVSEAAKTLQRRERGSPDQVWFKSPYLPDYFQNTFHYQTDGWLSTESAAVYETSTETLFVGRQDAMQRCTLVPLSDFMKGRDSSTTRALEIGCGTGRFATFVKDNYPTMDLTLTDLSPFYLQEARANLHYWKQQRAKDLNLTGVDKNGVTFMQAAAERLPFEDSSFDVVYSVYLFHELPQDVRHAAIREMARVLKPGGLIIMTDSVQTGDRPAIDNSLSGFGDFNEPFYRNYLADDLGRVFGEAGVECDLKVVSSTTKSLSFKKPLERIDSKHAEENDSQQVGPGLGSAHHEDPRLN